jgi:hypothetical protein
MVREKLALQGQKHYEHICSFALAGRVVLLPFIITQGVTLG